MSDGTAGTGTYTYQWLKNGVAIAGEDDDELFITEDMIGSKISVTVTSATGIEATSDETAPVIFADESEEVSIIDEMGLQSDGTGILGDVLRVAYGVSFGTPSAVTWYRNGSALTAQDVSGGAIAFRTAAITETGAYMAVVTNKKGETYQTNTIEITSREEPATILSFTIEDDYTDGTDITYNAQNRTAVATVVFEKNYAGTIGIYKKTDTKYTARVDSLVTNVTAATQTAAAATQGTVRDEASELCSTPATNYQVLNATNPGSGFGYIDNEGHVTYKFQVNDGALTRGTDYVVTFDQASISTDTPGTGKVNVFDEAVTVPYVQLPASMAVTKVSAGNAPEVTFYDENDNVLEWFGTATTKSAAFDTLAECGIASAQIYSATVKTNDTTKGTARGAATTNGLAGGVWTSGTVAPSPIDAYWFAQVKTTAGVFSDGQTTITSEAVPAAADAASDMDLIEKKGEATTATVSFSNLRSDGTLYIVRGYWDIARNGGVGTDTSGNSLNVGLPVEDHATTVEDIFAGFDQNDATTYVTSTPVTAGTASIDVENAISKFTTNSIVGAATAAADVIEGLTLAAGGDASAVASGKHFNNNYIAVFIPDDETNYGRIYTDGALGAPTTSSTNWTVGTTATAKSSLQITQAVWKYEVTGKGKDVDGGTTVENVSGDWTVSAAADNTTANVITVKDQFGDTRPSTTLADITWRFSKTNDEGNAFNSVTMTVDWDGSLGTNSGSGPAVAGAYNTITINDRSSTNIAAGGLAIGDKYTATTSTDQTITLECTGASTVATANATTDAAATWKVTIS